MSALTAFLLEQIAADEELLDWGKPLRIHVDPGGNGDATYPFHDRWKAECEAKRRIIARGSMRRRKKDAPLHTRGLDYDGDYIDIDWDTRLRGAELVAFEAEWYEDAPSDEIRILVAIYADRPGYDPGWAL